MKGGRKDSEEGKEGGENSSWEIESGGEEINCKGCGAGGGGGRKKWVVHVCVCTLFVLVLLFHCGAKDKTLSKLQGGGLKAVPRRYHRS